MIDDDDDDMPISERTLDYK